MINPPKRAEKKPLPFASIEERKSSSNYILWIVGTFLLVGLVVFILLALS